MPGIPKKLLPSLFNKTFLFLFSVALAALACTSGGVSENSESSDAVVPPPEFDISAPLLISQKAEDKELCSSIERKIEERTAPQERWGVMMVSLSDGRVLCGRNPKDLFSPASVLKIVTSGAALDKLGPDFTFKTSVYSQNEIIDGTLSDDLVLYGRGAPDFDKAALTNLVKTLKKKGLKKIKGNIVGDSSHFRSDGLGDGWTWNEAQWYYGAAASALSYERNLVTVSIVNGKPNADSGFVVLTGELQPVEDIEAIGIKRKLGSNQVYVWGNGSNLNARIAVSDPALFAARVFKESLEKSGIEVEGTVRSTDWINPSGAEKGIELASISSASLGELIRTMNKDSVNLHAELIVRTLGKRFGKEAPDKDPKMNRLRGDDLAGAAVVKKWLADNGVESGHLAIHDGSGLSRLDRMTPESIVRALLLTSKSVNSRPFTDSLPVAGRDGTLRGRLKNHTGKISAKTGSVTYANSLAGYAKRGSETVAFVIICNDEITRKDSTATIDAVASLLVASY